MPGLLAGARGPDARPRRLRGRPRRQRPGRSPGAAARPARQRPLVALRRARLLRRAQRRRRGGAGRAPRLHRRRLPARSGLARRARRRRAAEARAGGAARRAGADASPPRRPDAFALYDLVRGIPQARYVARGYAATANLRCRRGLRAPRRLRPRPALRAATPSSAAAPAAPAIRSRSSPEAVVAHPAAPTGRSSPQRRAGSRAARSPPAPGVRRLAWALRTLCPPLPDAPALYLCRDPASPRGTGAPRWRCCFRALGWSSSPRLRAFLAGGDARAPR